MAVVTEKNKKGAGRKPKIINWALVNRLCLFQCTQQEIADCLEIDHDTLQAACLRDHKIKFSQYYEQKRAGGKKSLRRRQWEVAVDDGNVTMLIWLGKQYLGQAEKQEHTGKEGGAIEIQLTDFPPEPKTLEEWIRQCKVIDASQNNNLETSTRPTG